MPVASTDLAHRSVKDLLIKQAVPASIGILFLTVNLLVDTILVGQWIGSLAIAALSVVMPITFFVSSMGMAIGMGGSSVLSLALGKGNKEKALHTFAHQIMMTLCICSVFVVVGLFFSEEVLFAFGANGAILPLAKVFFMPILLAVPFQALCMMGSTVVRAEGKARPAMIAMIVASVVNVVFDVVFIKILNMGVFGAAMATALSFFFCFVYFLWFFIYRSELRLKLSSFVFKPKLSKEIISLSSVTFARQGVISILAIILNHTLYAEGGEEAVAIYGIISRMLMFMLFPVLGITQGFMPIAGYNYGGR